MTGDYTASIEWLCEHAGVVRLHERGGSFGDPYVWACTVQNDQNQGAILKGVCAPLPHGGVHAIKDALRIDGFCRYRYDRRMNDDVRHVEKEIV